MPIQKQGMSRLINIILFVIYAVFGLTVCTLWLYDFLQYQQKKYSVISIIIFVAGNSLQCFLLYKSLFKKEVIKLYFSLIYLALIIAGVSIYVSTYSSSHHFSIWTVASVLTQILFSLYGTTFIMGQNQKRKDEEHHNGENDSAQELDRSSIFLYNPELYDDAVNSYNNNNNSEADNSLSCSEDDVFFEKKKYFNYCDKKKEEEENEMTDICRRFQYPERIDVSEDSITGVVDSLNPYSSQNLELHSSSMFI